MNFAKKSGFPIFKIQIQIQNSHSPPHLWASLVFWMELDREEWKTGRKILKFIHIFIIICLQGGWVDNYTWCWRGPHLTCRSHWCQLMVKIMMMTKMMVMVTMTIMMSGKVVDLPGVDEALVWLVVLIDEKLLPAFGKVRSTDCITMVLRQGKSMTREHFLDSNKSAVSITWEVI